MSAASTFKGLAIIATLACAMQHTSSLHSSNSSDSHLPNLNATSPLRFSNETVDPRPITDFVIGFIDHAVKTSAYNDTITAIINVFQEPTTNHSSESTGRATPEAFYAASFVKIIWQFVNGIAKPFLKTYLVPLQMLFTFMAPKMFLKDCFNVDTTALLTARSLSPFTIAPAAQAFFTCAVDIIAQVILCVKLLANMATSIF